MDTFNQEDMQRGYQICQDCRQGVFQLEAGFDCVEFRCMRCNCYVADRTEFFGKMDELAEVMSK